MQYLHFTEILETRIEEVRSGKKERNPEPAQAPEIPENAIPDPDVQQKADN